MVVIIIDGGTERIACIGFMYLAIICWITLFLAAPPIVGHSVELIVARRGQAAVGVVSRKNQRN